MKFKLIATSPKTDLPKGFYYVAQDNYYIANLNEPDKNNPEKYLYSDSATSCIIIIDEVLKKYSSTPEYEAPWFFTSMRISALYVKNHTKA